MHFFVIGVKFLPFLYRRVKIVDHFCKKGVILFCKGVSNFGHFYKGVDNFGHFKKSRSIRKNNVVHEAVLLYKAS